MGLGGLNFGGGQDSAQQGNGKENGIGSQVWESAKGVGEAGVKMFNPTDSRAFGTGMDPNAHNHGQKAVQAAQKGLTDGVNKAVDKVSKGIMGEGAPAGEGGIGQAAKQMGTDKVKNLFGGG